MTSPTISVVMPVYNGERFVREAIDSILSQTFDDFEFIIVDDGSTDSTPEILQEYAANDDRVVIVSRPNTGIVGALNDGIAKAQGEIIARMDADDVSLPERFDEQMAYMKAHPECVLLGTGYIVTDEHGLHLFVHKTLLTPEQIRREQLNGQGSAVHHPTVFIRRKALEAVGGYRSEYQWVEDLDLFLRLGEQGDVANLDRSLLLYRRHPGTVCSQRYLEQYIVLKKVIAAAYQRQSKPMPKNWQPTHGSINSNYTWYQYATNVALRNRDLWGAVKCSSLTWLLGPFSKESYQLLIKTLKLCVKIIIGRPT